MQVTASVSDRLAAEAQAPGVSLEMYIEQMLAQEGTVAEYQTPHRAR